jgi:pimeloyl-ACP methyl ester carboxylesterase
MTPTPFTIAIDAAVLTDIRDRVAHYPWDHLPDAGGWSCGTAIASLRDLVGYWLDSYEWREEEARLNELPQYHAIVDDIALHFVRYRGSNERNPPLLLSHGWPGSFVEFAPIVEQLAHPERFGGDAADGSDVIIPSLPGYGFSGRPRHPIGPRRTAELFDALMTKVLGYPSYIAQGGDWGAMITGWLGYRHAEHCRAIHLNMLGLRNREMAPASDAERAWAESYQARFQQEGAYLQLQGTRPQSLSFAMMDSPVGIAAWIIEKFAAWSDLPRDPSGAPDLGACYSPDRLLTNIMIYLVTRSFATSTWMYRGYFAEEPNRMAPGTKLETPTGIAAFRDPVYSMPPRSLVERGYTIVQWTDMPRGGHFAAMEAPELFVADVQKFLRLVR